MVVLSWLRLEIRRRWRSLAVIALLVALSSAVVMTSLAAARRGASTVTRLGGRTLPNTLALLPNQPGFDWSKIATLPEVDSIARFVVDYELAIDGVSGDSIGFPFVGPEFGRTMERPVIFSGRMFDPVRADEAVVTKRFVKTYHKHVGDTVVLHLPSTKDLDAALAGGSTAPLRGPTVVIHIVGVVVSPWISDSPDSKGGIQISPGLTAAYPGEILGSPSSANTQFVNALVRLRHDGADIPKFLDDVRRVTGRADIGILNSVQQGRDIQHQDAFESRCLVAFAIAAFVAALFLVGQAITRYAAASSAELQTLRALGMTPGQMTVTAAAGPAIFGLLGVGGGVIAAWVVSGRFPFGTAKLFEPTPGRQWDIVVMVACAALIAVLVAVGAAAAARLAIRAATRERAVRRSVVATALGRTGAAVPLVIGARFALEAGRGRTSVPVRPALVGALTGVLGIIAAFTFSHGVSDAASHPERFGQTFQLVTFIGINNEDFGPTPKVMDVLARQPEVTGVDNARIAVATAPNGRDTVSLFSYDRGAKPMDVVVLNGRMPVAADEVLLAPKSLAALHTQVGGTVPLTGNRTSAARQLRVVGSGFVPIGSHNNYSDGGWISQSGYDSLFRDFKFHLVLVSIRHDLNAQDTASILAARLNGAIPEVHGQAQLEAGQLPTEIAEIREVRTLPIVLGGFLALLAVGAVGHALATAVRRRSHDLAVLRAVGMTQWQCRWVVVTQATVLAVVGLVFGVPVGLAVGRTVWRAVADYTPIQYVPPLDAVALLLAAPAALLVANLLAAWPGRRAARLRVAAILRAE